MLQHGSDSRALVSHVSQQPAESAFVLNDSALQQPGGLDIREMFRILRRHLRIVIAAPLILFAAALVFIMAVQPLYTATATVLIDPRRASIVDIDNSNHPVLSNFNTDDVTTESQVMLI